MRLSLTLLLRLLSQSVLFNPILICISLLLNRRSQNLLFNQNLLLLQIGLTLSLGNLRINSCHLDRLLLLLLLDSISRICLSLLDISSTLQLALSNRQLILTLRNSKVGLHLRIIRLLLCLRLSNRHITLSYSLADRSVLADFRRIVGTKVNNQAIIIHDVLDIAAQNADAKLLHILRSLFQHLIGEGVTVYVNLLQIQRTDNLTHIAFQRILQAARNIRRLHIQKVSRRKINTVFLIHDNFCYSIYLNIDKIVRRHALARLDINRHLAQIQNVHTL